MAQYENACCMNGGNFLKSKATTSFSRRTLLLAVIVIIILVKILTKIIPISKSYSLRTHTNWWTGLYLF